MAQLFSSQQFSYLSFAEDVLRPPRCFRPQAYTLQPWNPPTPNTLLGAALAGRGVRQLANEVLWRGAVWGLLAGGVGQLLAHSDASDGLLFLGRVFGGEDAAMWVGEWGSGRGRGRLEGAGSGGAEMGVMTGERCAVQGRVLHARQGMGGGKAAKRRNRMPGD